MNNAALAKTLEQAQPIELECSPPLRSYPVRESTIEAVPIERPCCSPASRISAALQESGVEAVPTEFQRSLALRISAALQESAVEAVPIELERSPASRISAARELSAVDVVPIELERSPTSRISAARELSAVDVVPMPPRVVLPAPPTAAPRGFLQALWLRLFGPPAINLSAVSRDFGAFRAFSEIGSDYLPSSGTWPSSQGQTTITSGRS